MPVRVKIDGPMFADLVERLVDVRRWPEQFERDAHTRSGEPRFTIEPRTIKSRTLGANEVPGRVRIDTFGELCAFLGPLTHLTAAEHALYSDLVEHRHGPSVRLEQERIRFSLVQMVSSGVQSVSSSSPVAPR